MAEVDPVKNCNSSPESVLLTAYCWVVTIIASVIKIFGYFAITFQHHTDKQK